MPSITLNLNVQNAQNPVRKHFEKTNKHLTDLHAVDMLESIYMDSNKNIHMPTFEPWLTLIQFIPKFNQFGKEGMCRGRGDVTS